MKLNCPKCQKTWTDLEIENQVCSDCGATAEYDPDHEQLQKQLDNDPGWQKHLSEQRKKDHKSYWIQMIVYIVGAIIIAVIGSTILNTDLSPRAWLAIGFAIIIPVYHIFKSI